MAPRKVLLSRRKGILQCIVVVVLTVACITWIANVLPGSLQYREVPLGVAYAVSTEGADGETGPSQLTNASGDPIPTETVARGDSGPDFVSLDEILKNRTESVVTVAKELHLVFEEDGFFADEKPAEKFYQLINRESETTPIRNTANVVELITSIKLEKYDIRDVDSQAVKIENKARTFDGTATIEAEVFMKVVENLNEFFKDVDPGIQLRSDREEPDNGIQRTGGSPKPVQEFGSAYSVTEDVAREDIGRQVAPLADLQMEGTAAAGVRVVFTRPEAEKDGEFYVDPRGNVFRKASRMSHDACQQLLLMEDARHTGDIDCSYQYNHPAHTRSSPGRPKEEVETQNREKNNQYLQKVK